MELHSNPMSQKNKGTKKRAETILEGTKINVDGDSYGVFRSNDPIISMDNLATTTSPHTSDAHHMGADHPTSYCETMMHLFKGNVGSGIFALGDAFKNAGLLLGPPLTIFLGIICVHAQHILEHDCSGYENDAIIKHTIDLILRHK